MNREFKLALFVTFLIGMCFYFGVIRPYSHRTDEISKVMSKPPVVATATPTPGVSL